MPTVFVYLGEGTYRGPSEFSWQSPEVGARHKLMLFLAQATNEADEHAAIRELARFGFVDAQLSAGKAISVESLNVPGMRAFQKHYEEALSEGSSVVWYPEVLPHAAG